MTEQAGNQRAEHWPRMGKPGNSEVIMLADFLGLLVGIQGHLCKAACDPNHTCTYLYRQNGALEKRGRVSLLKGVKTV